MGDIVEVPIPVSPGTAKMLRDPARRREMGALLDRIVLPNDPVERVKAVMDEIGRRAEAAGLTEEEIEAELAAHERERTA